jgi:hypothetical protein
MGEIKTNNRFDSLTNLDISTHYRNIEFWVMLSSFQAAFTYWVVAQNPNKELIDIRPSLRAFRDHIATIFDDPRLPEQFTYEQLQEVINEEALGSIPEILELNKLKPDFIDLGALARNVFYMILREHITQD